MIRIVTEAMSDLTRMDAATLNVTLVAQPLRFGMEDDVCYSQEEIGEKLQVSKERARQIEQQAIHNLKKLSAGLGLEDFLV